jgi:hypothetical protein
VFRAPDFSLSNSFLRAVILVLLGGALFLFVSNGAHAAEPTSTPSAWEYAYETAPAAEQQPAASTNDDLRLAAGLSIVAVIAITTLVLAEREPAAAGRDAAPLALPGTTKQPAAFRPLPPVEVAEAA